MSIMNHKGGFAGQIFLAAKAKAKKDDYLLTRYNIPKRNNQFPEVQLISTRITQEHFPYGL